MTVATDDIVASVGRCSIDGCDSIARARGWCGMHYQRWYAHGDPLVVDHATGPRNGRWVGDSIGYAGLHYRLSQDRRLGPCAMCGHPADTWAYDHADPNERLVMNGNKLCPVSIDLDHYFPACWTCHNRFDHEMKVAA